MASAWGHSGPLLAAQLVRASTGDELRPCMLGWCSDWLQLAAGHKPESPAHCACWPIILVHALLHGCVACAAGLHRCCPYRVGCCFLLPHVSDSLVLWPWQWRAQPWGAAQCQQQPLHGCQLHLTRQSPCCASTGFSCMLCCAVLQCWHLASTAGMPRLPGPPYSSSSHLACVCDPWCLVSFVLLCVVCQAHLSTVW